MTAVRTTLRIVALILAMAVNIPALVTGLFVLLFFWPLGILLAIVLVVTAVYSGLAALTCLCLLLALVNGFLLVARTGSDHIFGLLGIAGCLWVVWCLFRAHARQQQEAAREQQQNAPEPAQKKTPQP